MNDICVPLPRIPDANQAEVHVKIAGQTRSFNYRVEAFEWQPAEGFEGAYHREDPRLQRIAGLKRSIENYEKGWELVQIYNPGPRDRHIQVLFRQKNYA